MLVAGGQELVGVEAEAQRQRFLNPQAGLAPVKNNGEVTLLFSAQDPGRCQRMTIVHMITVDCWNKPPKTKNVNNLRRKQTLKQMLGKSCHTQRTKDVDLFIVQLAKLFSSDTYLR